MNRTPIRISAATLGAVAVTAGMFGAGTVGSAHADEPAPIDNPIAVGHVANLGSDRLNLRQGPSQNAPVIGSMPSGQRVTVLCWSEGVEANDNSTWYKSAPSGDQTYWVSADFIEGLDKPVIPCDQIPPGQF